MTEGQGGGHQTSAPDGPEWPAPPADGRQSPGALALPVEAPAAPVPLGPRHSGLLFAGAAVSAAIALVLAGIVVNNFLDSRGPRAVATRYLAAIADGDASTALAYAAHPPTSAPYLTDRVLAEQLRLARLTRVLVRGVRQSGGTATVLVSYVLDFAGDPVTQQDRIDLIKHGSSWRLRRVATDVTLPGGGPGADRLTFAGRPFTSISGLIFPGALPIGTDTAAVVVTNHPAVRLTDDSSFPAVDAEVSADTRRQVEDALGVALTRCLSAESVDPRCPVVPGGRPVPGSLHGSLVRTIAESSPRVTLSARGNGVIEVSAAAQLNAEWRTWDFNNLEQARHEITTVTVNAVSSVDSPRSIIWTSGE